jgi:amyloid beta precursor protein binding protein 1
MREDDLLALDAACREHGVQLVVARSYGLVGHVRISVPVRTGTGWLRQPVTHSLLCAQEHTVVESKPDNVPDDLRVAAPWPELLDFCAGFQLAACDDVTHKHVPYLVLLVRALADWRAAHDGASPGSSAERSAFKEALRAMARSHDQENVREALSAAHKAWAPAGVPADIDQLLNDPAVAAAAAAPAGAPDFWLLAAALKAFIAAEGAGALPLEGHIPDMTSTTDAYVHLQRLYAARAAADATALEAHLAPLLRAGGRAPGAVSRDAVRTFCKNAGNLAVLRYAPLAQEVGAFEAVAACSSSFAHSHAARGAALARALAAEDAQRANAVMYLLLRAADRFAQQYGRYPGIYDRHARALAPLLLVPLNSYPVAPPQRAG